MKRIWLMAVLSMKDSLRARVWIPLALGIIAAVWFVWTFSLGPRDGLGADVINGYFVFLSGGLYLSGLVVGATSVPLERRVGVMFTLPISRTEIVIGKLLGTQIVVGCGLIMGYFISLSLAVHYNLTGFANNSWLALATVLTMSFTYLCVSIPLGFWMSGAPTLITAWLIVNLPPRLQHLVDQRVVTGGVSRLIKVLLSVVPGQIETGALNSSGAFSYGVVEPGAYLDLGRAAFFALVFFMLLTALAQKKELSTKS